MGAVAAVAEDGEGGGGADLGEEWKRGLTCDSILPRQLWKVCYNYPIISRAKPIPNFLPFLNLIPADREIDIRLRDRRGLPRLVLEPRVGPSSSSRWRGHPEPGHRAGEFEEIVRVVRCAVSVREHGEAAGGKHRY